MNKRLLTIILIGNILLAGTNLYLYKIPKIEEYDKNKVIILTLHKTKEKLRAADAKARYLEQLLDSKTKKGKLK